MVVDVRRLMVLRAARDAGGILAAAELLRVSSSAVSQQLSKLERETGLGLLDRSSGGRVRLTPAGVRLAERADAIAGEMRAAEREVGELAEVRSRAVRVSAFPTAIQALLAPAAARLRDAHPGIGLRISEARGEVSAQHAALLSGTLDIAVVKQEPEARAPGGVTETVLRDDPYRIVVPSSWPVPAALTELLDRPWVKHPRSSSGFAPLARIEESEGVTLHYEHECTEYPVALALVRAGLAAAVVPDLALQGELGDPRVRVVGFGDLGARRIVAHYASGAERALAVAATLDALRGGVPVR